MFYIPSAPTIKSLPSLSSLYTYGSFQRDRPLSPLEQPILSISLFQFPRSIKIETVADTPDFDENLIIDVKDSDTSSGPHTSGRPEEASFATSGSWGSLHIRPGDGSMLVRMGLVPSLSQDSVMDFRTSGRTSGPWDEDEQLEVEVFRNASRDASDWGDSSIDPERDSILELEGCMDVFGPERNAWPYCSSPEPFSPDFSISPMEGDLLASSTSFFQQILASSSPLNSCTRPSRNINDILESDNSFEFSFPLSPRRCATSGAEYAMGTQALDSDASDLEFSVDLEDMKFDPSMDLLAGSSIGLDGDTSLLGHGIPSLPTESDIKKLLACGAVVTSCPFDTPTFSDLPSTPSFIIPTSFSMDSLLRMPLDIPDLSCDSSTSSLLSASTSTYHFPTFPSAEDLVRVAPPPDFDSYDADIDAFQPLPHDTVSPLTPSPTSSR